VGLSLFVLRGFLPLLSLSSSSDDERVRLGVFRGLGCSLPTRSSSEDDERSARSVCLDDFLLYVFIIKNEQEVKNSFVFGYKNGKQKVKNSLRLKGSKSSLFIYIFEINFMIC
jgi:hypothetical protein